MYIVERINASAAIANDPINLKGLHIEDPEHKISRADTFKLSSSFFVSTVPNFSLADIKIEGVDSLQKVFGYTLRIFVPYITINHGKSVVIIDGEDKSIVRLIEFGLKSWRKNMRIYYNQDGSFLINEKSQHITNAHDAFDRPVMFGR